MKKSLILGLLLSATVVTACGGNGSSSKPASTPAPSTPSTSVPSIPSTPTPSTPEVEESLGVTLEELKNTDENTEVFKQAGNLLIKVDYKDALDDAEDKLETLKLRKQTMARQEERVMKKLEEMQTNIQAAMQGMAPNGA